MEVLDRSGAVEGLRETALVPTGMVMHAGRSPVATMRFAPDERAATQALFVSQAAVEQRLRARLAELGVAVEWGVEVTGVGQDPHRATVTTAGHGTVAADWVLGCDGAGSVVRTAAGIGFPGVPVVERFLLADVVCDWDRDRTTSSGWFTEAGVLLAIPQTDPSTGEATWRLMADADPEAGRLSPEAIVARLAAALAERAGQPDVHVRRTVWTSVFRIHRRLADRYRRGRVLLAGDAAHIHSPFGGQGMTTGIGDAENVAWKLAMVSHGLAGPTLLDSYTAERRPLAVDVLRRTTGNTALLVRGDPVSRLVRDRIVLPLLRSSRVQRAATRQASQLGVSYRRGPLTRGLAAGRSGPRPGDRVPDALGTTIEGSAERLYAALRSGWAALAGTEKDVAAIADAVGTRLGVLSGLVSDRPGVGEGWLVRPDGHLAWRGRPGDRRLPATVDRFTAR